MNEQDKPKITNIETPILSRNEILRKLGECITAIHNKLTNGRQKDPAKMRLKMDMMKCQCQLANVYLSGLRDLEMEELSERLSKLEQERKG